jgi:tRNA (cytosine49-C5)-methyltransferase
VTVRQRRGKSARAQGDAKRRQFLDRTSRALGLDPDEVDRRFRPSGLGSGRANPLRGADGDAARRELAQSGIEATPLDWYPDGLTFTAPRADVAATPAVADGRFFVQNASSFLPNLALQPQPGDSLLDMCAAPGAKTSHLVALAGGDLDVWANDAIAARIARIEDVESTLGFSVATKTSHPAQYLDKYVDRTFDRILLDAQCSGEGLLDLSFPTAFRYWSLARIAKYHHLQTKMLATAFKLLRPGGTLVYSTCTVAPEENEAPVSTLLSREPDARVEPLALAAAPTRPPVLQWERESFDGALAGALRLAPAGPFEAFFLCRIRKLGSSLTVDDLAPLDLAAEGRRVAGTAAGS